jgi:N6-L-threonylcarbamoyladenine synthase
MIILGIETSCDETAAAVVQNGEKILSSVVASSVDLHQKTGGIIPEVAAREQGRFIIPVIKEALSQACIKPQDLDGIAVTSGPGLIGSLLVGVETARTLAYTWQKQLVPINHLQAHLYANWLGKKQAKPQFPALGLVVSGGHTDLILMTDHGQIKWLGGTRDDAAGECFDKCARLLELGYPGGPAISRAAKGWQPGKKGLGIKLPRPMIKEDNLDFSFSGLKTAVLSEVKKLKEKKQFKKETIVQLAWEIEQAIVEVLVKKTQKAALKYQPHCILLAGGVSANPLLREKMLKQFGDFPVLIPPFNLCTDNATFVAAGAYFNFHPIPWSKIQADSSLEIAEMIKSA